MRITIGIIAIALPFVLALGGYLLFALPLQISFSIYYYTPMQDIFVGMLCMLGILLIIDQYRGHFSLPSIIAGTLAITVALLPTSEDNFAKPSIINIIHSLGALCFFIILSLITLRKFTKEVSTPTQVYLHKSCGLLILASVALFIALRLSPIETRQALQTYEAIFWLETVATLAFGVSWFAKGYCVK
jgi:uncharacterized membrane protein